MNYPFNEMWSLSFFGRLKYDVLAHHAHSLYGLSKSLQQNRDDVGVGSRYRCQQLPPNFREDLTGGDTNIGNLEEKSNLTYVTCFDQVFGKYFWKKI